MSRINILDVAPVAPGTCILCGSAGGDGRKFVDFGKQVDWIGAIYFCTECFGEVARAIGWVPVAEFNELNAEVKSLKSEATVHVNQNKRILDALRIIFVELDRDPDTVDTYLERMLESAPEPEEDEPDDSGTSPGEQEADESDNVEGSDDLFDASDFDDE